MTTAAPSKEIAKKPKALPELLADVNIKKQFEGMLGKEARGFLQNMLTVYQGNKALQDAEPNSIISAAAISASINLSILPSLGYSCIVPYKQKDGTVAAQWQLMVRGVIQLALRSKRYAKINIAYVYEGQLVSYDEFKGSVVLNSARRKSDRIQGFYFYFRLHDGQEFETYWSAKKCIEHGLRFSKAFQGGSGPWTEDPAFESAGSVKKWLAGKEHFLTEGSGAVAMSAKTIVKNSLLKWGPLDTRVAEIITMDQAAIGPDGKPSYIDATAEREDGTATGGKTYAAPPERQVGQEPTPAQKLAWCKEAAAKQGVSAEAFDAWIAAQGDKAEAEVAESAAALWKRVQTKEIKAVDAFKVPEAKKGEKTAAKADVPGEKEAAFLVASVIPTDFEGADAWAIRDTSEEPIKYYSDDAAVAEAAEKAKTNGTQLAVKWVDRKVEKKAVRWITRLVG